ncbi:MAG: hypothetical protein R6T90_04385, partial [Dissulfuribacterales bacterium]
MSRLETEFLNVTSIYMTGYWNRVDQPERFIPRITGFDRFARKSVSLFMSEVMRLRQQTFRLLTEDLGTEDIDLCLWIFPAAGGQACLYTCLVKEIKPVPPVFRGHLG